MESCKTVSTPLVTGEKYQKEDGSQKVDDSMYRSLIGSLLYLTATRPDIMFSTSLLSRFMQSPSQVHNAATKRILRYLRGTKDFGIWYKSTNDAKLVEYTDSDWAGSVDDMKSTSGYIFSLGSGIFSWASKKQATVAQSSAEAEYIAAAATSNQAIWLRRILEDIGEKQEEPTTIYCDNKSAIAITKNPVQHNRTKHINIKYHSLREATTRGEIELKNVLDDAESRRYKDKTVHSWLKKLEDLSYDIDDVLDEWNFAALKLQIEGSVDVRLRRTVCPFISSCLCFNKVAMRRDIAKKIKSLKERLNEILNEKDEFGFVVNQPVVDPRESTRVRSVSLVEGGSGRQLAQLLYNDDRLVYSFELKIWVCVSDVFDEFRIAHTILESVKKESSNLKELESLLNLLKNSIYGKNFLLVLDDVWTEDYKKWEPFRNSLNYGAPGSKILVTTRSERVARMMGIAEIHRLGQLSDINCWLLMKRVAFHGRSEADSEELQEIGKKIADKCKGLPLAAKVLGSLLRFKDTKKAWESVLESEIWQLEEAEVELFPHLFLSYNELSPTMKRCFSYCSIFPKDWVIDVEKLIRMWMDLGYLSSTGSTNEDLELRGKEITGSEESDGSIEASNNKSSQAFRLSLVSQSKMYRSLYCQEELSHQQLDFLTFLRVLRLCSWQDIPRGKEKLIHLRYLDASGHNWSSEKIPKGIRNLTRLRNLVISYNKLKEIPREIEYLIRLRHLDLTWNRDIKELPETICNLCDLEILNLNYCYDLRGTSRVDRRTHELSTPLQYRMYQSPSDSLRNREINWLSDNELVSCWKRMEQIGILEGVGPTEWIIGAEDQTS
ncbi:UNVERIFIED_CONTAM: putative disease resistance protein RGA3 [Sesamum angustifolium]|uniref:Disease resistance protein RGA3 n=1 Tax=Sesamum angustifolium TaxID=2727405 RepID=A0AAW2LLL0_9LAMI